jgi:hypothetical protein
LGHFCADAPLSRALLCSVFQQKRASGCFGTWRRTIPGRRWPADPWGHVRSADLEFVTHSLVLRLYAVSRPYRRFVASCWNCRMSLPIRTCALRSSTQSARSANERPEAANSGSAGHRGELSGACVTCGRRSYVSAVTWSEHDDDHASHGDGGADEIPGGGTNSIDEP